MPEADLSFLLDFTPKLTGTEQLVGEIQKLTRETHMSMLPEVLKAPPEKMAQASKGFGASFLGSIKNQMLESGGLRTIMAGVLGGDIGGVGGSLLGMGGEAVGAGAGAMLGAAGGPIGAVIGALASTLADLPQMLKGLFDKLSGFAALASPALFKQFQIAVEDAQAVIGDAFLPVLQMVTEGVRLFGDILATILPNFSEMQEALSPIQKVFDDLEKTIREIVGEVGPFIRQVLLVSIRLAAEEFRLLYMAMEPLIHLLTSPVGLGFLAGIAGGGGGGMRSGSGAAARPASITGIEQYQQQLQIAAFSVPGRNYAEETADNTMKILGRLMDVLQVNLVQNVIDKVNKVIDDVKDRSGLHGGTVGRSSRQGNRPDLTGKGPVNMGGGWSGELS